MTAKLTLLLLVAFVSIGALSDFGQASRGALAGNTTAAPTSAALTSNAQAGILGSLRKIVTAPIDYYKSYRALPRMAPRGKGLSERIANFGIWAASFGPINGLRTRLRHARYTTEPLEAMSDGRYAVDLSARQPLLIPGGALPLPNIRHAHVGLLEPGKVWGDWSHLLMSGIRGKNAQGKTILFPSQKYALDPAFTPDARYDLLRISSEDPALLAQTADYVADQLGAAPEAYVPGKRTCVTFGCDSVRSFLKDPEMKLPLRARWNGGWMQRYFIRNPDIFADGVRVEWVEQALVARDKTRGKLGPAIDWLLGRPGRPGEGVVSKLGIRDPWQQNRVIRMEPKFTKPAGVE